MSATEKAAQYMTPDIIRMRINYAMWYLQGLYKENASYAHMSEGYGLPFATKGQASGKIRLSGFYELDEDSDKVEWTYVYGHDEDSLVPEHEEQYHYMRVAFKMPDGMGGYDYGYPTLGCYVYHYTDGNMYAHIDVLQMKGDARELYFGNTCIENDLDSGETPSWGFYPSAKWRGWPQNRYGMRHGSLFGRAMFAALADMTKSGKLKDTREASGFYADLYDPIFGLSKSEAVGYFFATSGNPHKDCDYGVGAEDGALPWGLDPNRYSYESKFCTWRGSCGTPYSGEYQLQRSTFVKCLQAIHVLNKYNDPSYSYQDGEYNYVTPAQVAMNARSKWNNIGLSYDNTGGLYPPSTIAVAYATCVWNILETLLGYKYGDATARQWADKCMEKVFPYIQWGVQYPHDVDGKGEDYKYGVLRRNDNMGGVITTYDDGGTYPMEYHNVRGFALGLVDAILNMPDEMYDPVPVGHESTSLYCQALRTYLHYKYGIDCPTSAYLPCID